MNNFMGVFMKNKQIMNLIVLIGGFLSISTTLMCYKNRAEERFEKLLNLPKNDDTDEFGNTRLHIIAKYCDVRSKTPVPFISNHSGIDLSQHNYWGETAEDILKDRLAQFKHN